MRTIMLFLLSLVTLSTASCKEPKVDHSDKWLGKLEPGHKITTVKNESDSKFIQVALLLDTSNSMDGLIHQAKTQLWEIVNELSYAKCGDHKIKLQIALYEYGNDYLSAEEGYVRQVLSFSEDLDLISKELFALKTNGGNEFCGKVMKSAIEQLNWSKDETHLKLMFIAGNEPFDQGRVSYKDITQDAIEKDIAVNTIYCGNYQQGVQTLWKDGADRSKGEYIAIDHNVQVVHINTPYDDEILKLNQQLNKTYIYYGSKGTSKMAMQAEQDMNAKRTGKTNAVNRAISKSSSFYVNKNWDLVDAVKEEDFELSEVDKNDIPKELRSKTKSELKSYLLAKEKERNEIQKEIQSLNKKRQAYIKQKQQGNNQSTLESALTKAIKSQGNRKSFTW